MVPVSRTGMDRRFVYFAILSIIGSALLLPFVAFVFSSLTATGAAPMDEPMSEVIAIYFLTVSIALTVELFALPVTLPFAMGAWIASHWYLFGIYREKWRVRVSALVSGIAGIVGFTFWLVVLENEEKWQSMLVVLTPAVLIAAIMSAEIVYRPAKRQTA